MNRLATTFLFIATSLSWFADAAIGATINKCISSDGRIEFTDQPCPSGARSPAAENALSSKSRPIHAEKRQDNEPPLSSTRSKESATTESVAGRSQPKIQQSPSPERESGGSGSQEPKLSVPDRSSPPIAAFIAWHNSLLKNDFPAYQNTLFWPPEMKVDKEPFQRQMFDQLRTTTPTILKIADQKTRSGGALEFTAVGCRDGLRLVNLIVVNNANGVWRVVSSGWTRPWNKTAKLCPV